jgi:hypothetical protein
MCQGHRGMEVGETATPPAGAVAEDTEIARGLGYRGRPDDGEVASVRAVNGEDRQCGELGQYRRCATFSIAALYSPDVNRIPPGKRQRANLIRSVMNPTDLHAPVGSGDGPTDLWSMSLACAAIRLAPDGQPSVSLSASGGGGFLPPTCREQSVCKSN